MVICFSEASTLEDCGDELIGDLGPEDAGTVAVGVGTTVERGVGCDAAAGARAVTGDAGFGSGLGVGFAITAAGAARAAGRETSSKLDASSSSASSSGSLSWNLEAIAEIEPFWSAMVGGGAFAATGAGAGLDSFLVGEAGFAGNGAEAVTGGL